MIVALKDVGDILPEICLLAFPHQFEIQQ